MPEEPASKLHMEEHKISPQVRMESPYESAGEKILYCGGDSRSAKGPYLEQQHALTD